MKLFNRFSKPWLSNESLAHVADAVRTVETRTDAELVTVLAKKADSYWYIPTLWAALLGLLVPLLITLTPFWLDWQDLFLIQWVTFLLAALIFRIPYLMMLLVPKEVKFWRANNLAKRQFLENNLHHTVGETGVLIFVSVAERYVEILADRGVDQHVSPEDWQSIIDRFIIAIKNNNTEQGLVDCIGQCGALLEKCIPATSAKNELPNHLVLI